MKGEKSTIEEIRIRFDQDVERFSNLETGQVSTVDAVLSLELLTEAAKRLAPNATHLLDVGCGAGNYTLKMLSKLPDLNCTLLDLSKPMLDRAFERVSSVTNGTVKIIQSDIRTASLPVNQYDIVMAGAVLHHLREDADWTYTFTKMYRTLKPGGCLLISDLVSQELDILTGYTWERYGSYLETIGGAEYRDKILDYVEKEDTPRSMNYQLNLMKNVGFRKTDVLHKNLCFAMFLGIK
ncbi:MAG: class I SAM-dependent methyltransferase [Bacteroidales bacterium]|jgi:tRNA (cmo5U34)-methyltransferase|nr:class I SAM-dependent methyltransferase [Bacteroidales bacterium]